MARLYDDIIRQLGIVADFLTGETLIDSGSAEQNINGDGKLTLSWSQVGGNVIPAGTVIDAGPLGKYFLKDDYVPVDNGNGTCSYSPSFISEDARLGKILFSMDLITVDSAGNEETETMYTFPYTGTVGTIAQQLASAAGCTVDLGTGLSDVLISVNFDGDTVKSAAQKIAGACGKTAIFTGGTIGIGTAEAYSPDDYYNYFVVLGGTRNMGKRTLKGRYTSVTRRLTIGTPGSVLDYSGGGEKMMKLLINDEIYPKMELTISSVRSRECYMLDDNGTRIVDHYEGDGELAVPVYKRYHKFYITLELENNVPYSLDTETVIAGKPLGILFQSGLLMGREFDLAYFDPEHEPAGGFVENEADDVNTFDGNTWQGFTVEAGSYRIIMQADGDLLLPNSTLAPAVGDKVTLTGVALSQGYVNRARQELLDWGTATASFFNSGKAASFQMKSNFGDSDFLLGGTQAPPIGTPVDSSGNIIQPRRDGQSESDYIVTSVQTDLVTGGQVITYGTFKPKGLLQSIVDKLESVQLKGGGGYVGGEDYYRQTASMGIDQFNALRSAGGALGMVTVNQKINQAAADISGLEDALDDVKEQADRKFDVWFGNGFPIPNKDAAPQDQQTSSYPASEWVTDEQKAQHIQDIFYDMSREPSQTGGRAWRWMAYSENDVTVYRWEDITDSDTLTALEQISDVARDGKLTGGAEKMRVYIDWLHAYEFFGANVNDRNMALAPDELENYIDKFAALGYILNNGSTIFTVEPQDGGTEYTAIETPAWLSQNPNDPDNIYTTTVIGDVTDYYTAWYEYYQAAAQLSAALISAADTAAATALQILSNMAGDNVITIQEKESVLREWLSVNSEKASLVVQARRARITSGSAYTDYMLKFRTLATYLDNPSYSSLLDEGNIPGNSDTTFPAMLRAGTNSSVNGEAFSQCWEEYYDARSTLMSAIATTRQSYFVGTSVPAPPYNAGDLWMKTATPQDINGILMICTTPKGDNATASESDWTEFAPNTADYRILMCALAEKLFSVFGDGIYGKKLYFGGIPTSALSDSLWYDASTGRLAYRSGGSWTYYSTDSADIAILTDAFRSVYDLLGARDITVYGGQRPQQAGLYDLFLSPVTYTDSFSQKQLEGGIEIMLYGENGWELLMQSVNGVLENLGNFIRSIVFGSDSSDIVTASGAIIAQKFVQLFSEARIYDPENEDSDENGFVPLTQALFGLSVEAIKDGTGNVLYFEDGVYTTDSAKIRSTPAEGYAPVYRSLAKMSADRIDFAGKVINLKADQIGFNGTIVAKDANDNPTLQIDNDGNVNTRGNVICLGGGIYSKMDDGKFEIGSISDGQMMPRYRVAMVVRDGDIYPVFELVDGYGNIIGQLDEQLFKKNRTEDSWEEMSFIRIQPGVTEYDDIKSLNGTPYYCYHEGYTTNVSIDPETGEDIVTKIGNNSGIAQPSIFNGKWFAQRNPTVGNFIEDGYYVDTVNLLMNVSRVDPVIVVYRKVYQFNNGTMTETGQILAKQISGTN